MTVGGAKVGGRLRARRLRLGGPQKTRPPSSRKTRRRRSSSKGSGRRRATPRKGLAAPPSKSRLPSSQTSTSRSAPTCSSKRSEPSARVESAGRNSGNMARIWAKCCRKDAIMWCSACKA